MGFIKCCEILSIKFSMDLAKGALAFTVWKENPLKLSEEVATIYSREGGANFSCDTEWTAKLFLCAPSHLTPSPVVNTYTFFFTFYER